MTHCIVLLGHGCSGKDFMRDILINQYKYKSIVGTTTRPPRSGEIEGQHYHFVTETHFQLLMQDKDKLVEWAQFDGYYYGIESKEFANNPEENQNLVLIQTPDGLATLKKKIKLQMYAIYLNISAEVRKDRFLNNRKYSIEKCEDRMHQDEVKFKDFKQYNFMMTHSPFEIVPNNKRTRNHPLDFRLK